MDKETYLASMISYKVDLDTSVLSRQVVDRGYENFKFFLAFIGLTEDSLDNIEVNGITAWADALKDIQIYTLQANV